MNQQIYVPEKENKRRTSDTSVAASLVMVLWGLVILLVALLWPLASIWALNTLFAFEIKFTFWSWLSAWILILTLQGAITISHKRQQQQN